MGAILGLDYLLPNTGGLCNFLHLKPVSRSLRKELFKEQKKRFKDTRYTHLEETTKLGHVHKFLLKVAIGGPIIKHIASNVKG